MLEKISAWCSKYIYVIALISVTLMVTASMSYIYANKLPTENDRSPMHMVNTIMNHQKSTANTSSPEENTMQISTNQISKNDDVENDNTHNQSNTTEKSSNAISIFTDSAFYGLLIANFALFLSICFAHHNLKKIKHNGIALIVTLLIWLSTFLSSTNLLNAFSSLYIMLALMLFSYFGVEEKK